jgi:hypothetical protein
VERKAHAFFTLNCNFHEGVRFALGKAKEHIRACALKLDIPGDISELFYYCVGYNKLFNFHEFQFSHLKMEVKLVSNL